MSEILAHIAAGLVGLWGVAHAILNGFTGARTPVIWFKVCPVLLSTSAMLRLIASA